MESLYPWAGDWHGKQKEEKHRSLPPRMDGNKDTSPTRKRERMNALKTTPRSSSHSSGSSSSEDLEVAALNLLQGLVSLAQEQRKTRRSRRKRKEKE